MSSTAAVRKRDWLPADPVKRWLFFTAVGAAALYCGLLEYRPEYRAYGGFVVLKASMCVLLAGLAWRSGGGLVMIALLFSAVGDALLAIDGERLFVPGLASFLVTHLLYATVFILYLKITYSPIAGWRLVAAISLVVFAITYTAVLWPRLGALGLPVALYIVAIVTMALLSLRITVPSVAAGAISFVISDSLLALEKFIWSGAWLGPAIWVTYALAQLLIAYGLFMQAPPNGDTVRALTRAISLRKKKLSQT